MSHHFAFKKQKIFLQKSPEFYGVPVKPVLCRTFHTMLLKNNDFTDFYGKPVQPILFHTILFVLDVIKDASDVAPSQQIRHLTSAGTSMTEKSKLLLRTLSTRRNALSLKFLQRRHMPPFPLNYSHENSGPHGEGKALITDRYNAHRNKI